MKENNEAFINYCGNYFVPTRKNHLETQYCRHLNQHRHPNTKLSSVLEKFTIHQIKFNFSQNYSKSEICSNILECNFWKICFCKTADNAQNCKIF
jgi:hypothetical protein